MNKIANLFLDLAANAWWIGGMTGFLFGYFKTLDAGTTFAVARWLLFIQISVLGAAIIGCLLPIKGGSE